MFADLIDLFIASKKDPSNNTPTEKYPRPYAPMKKDFMGVDRVEKKMTLEEAYNLFETRIAKEEKSEEQILENNKKFFLKNKGSA